MAAKPDASEAALELYGGLEPAFTTGDEEQEWAALRFCIALVSGDLDLIHEAVIDWTDEDGVEVPGWQILLDPARCPAAALPWLGQFVGVTVSPYMTEAEARAAVSNPEGFNRGTVAQIEAVARRFLTGTKTVLVTEQYTGLPWRLLVETLEAETPELEAMKAAVLREAKPIGLVLFLNTRAAWHWLELRTEPTSNTWLKVRTKFATWKLTRTYKP